MRKLWFISVLLVFCPCLALGQVPTVGVYLDSTGTNCNLVDDGTGLFKAYVVVHTTIGLKAVQFSAPRPACLDAAYIGDAPIFPLMIGNSQTGVSIPFGGVLNSTIHVLTILYAGSGTTPPCCYYPILPHPDAGIVGVVDYGDNLLEGLGLNHTVNGDTSCFCGINPAPAVPANPFPADGSGSAPVVTVLSWESSDPEGDPLVYDVYFGTDPDPPLAASNHPDPSYSLDILEYGSSYYWKIVVKDDHFNEVEGPLWSFGTRPSSDSRLVVEPVLNYCGHANGDTVVVEVMLENTQLPIDTGGADINYDPSLLTFLDCQPGGLTTGWPLLSGSDLGSAIRMTGASASAIPSGSSGSFARLFFLSSCCNADTASQADLCPVNPADDLRALFPVCGEYSCEIFYADGDVNDDGAVSPADALCAFYGYLSYPNSPGLECGPPGWEVRGDADCSGDITPSDALCIFKSWLDGSCALCQEYPGGTLLNAEFEPARLSVRDIRIEPLSVVVAISLSAPGPVDALGFDVRFPDELLEFAVLTKTAWTSDFDQFDGILVEPGRIRLGGFTVEPAAATGETDLVELRFRRRTGALTGQLSLNRYVDDLKGSGTVMVELSGWDGKSPSLDRYRLFQNHPNPFNPWTEIRYEIPDGVEDIPVKLSIYNIEGKFVRSLVDTRQGAGAYRVMWDGRNQAGQSLSSGVYLYLLRAGDVNINRKMVLLK